MLPFWFEELSGNAKPDDELFEWTEPFYNDFLAGTLGDHLLGVGLADWGTTILRHSTTIPLFAKR